MHEVNRLMRLEVSGFSFVLLEMSLQHLLCFIAFLVDLSSLRCGSFVVLFTLGCGFVSKRRNWSIEFSLEVVV